MLKISAGDLVFIAEFQRRQAPLTVAAVEKLLPLRDKVIHGRWSGEAVWVPFGNEYKLGVSEFENATCHPSAGEILIYIGGMSEVEILLPYGNACFASKAGTLPGNHFATIVDGGQRLAELGRKVLWEGAQDIVLERVRAPGNT